MLFVTDFQHLENVVADILMNILIFLLFCPIQVFYLSAIKVQMGWHKHITV